MKRLSVNAEMVLQMVKPYLVENTITYWEFDNLFEILSKQEQYEVIDVLINNSIDLIDPPPTKSASEGDDALQIKEDNAAIEEFLVKYDDVFQDQSTKTEYEFQYTNIRQSNETLCYLVQQGNQQAKNDICNKNQGLVRKFAIHYEKYCGNGLDIEDLIQVGFMGLLKAAERFDASKECAFSTYAVWWIRQSITREIADSANTIRIPVHMVESVNKATRIDGSLSHVETDFFKRVKLVANEMNCGVDQVLEYFAIRNCIMSTVSLDVPIGEDQDTPLWQFLPEKGTETIEEQYEGKELKTVLGQVLEQLTPKERDILIKRFGIDDGTPLTLEEIGAQYNLTRERIRQIEAKALRKMRHPSRIKRLEDFMTD